jgi:hypothetical protein
MVYVALFGAIAMQNASFGVFIWFYSVGNRAHDEQCSHINSYLTIPIRNKIQKVIPYVAVIGVLFILRV